MTPQNQGARRDRSLSPFQIKGPEVGAVVVDLAGDNVMIFRMDKCRTDNCFSKLTGL